MVVLIVKVEPIEGDVVLGVAVIEIAGVGSPRMILAAIATGRPNDGALQLIALSRRTPAGGLSMMSIPRCRYWTARPRPRIGRRSPACSSRQSRPTGLRRRSRPLRHLRSLPARPM